MDNVTMELEQLENLKQILQDRGVDDNHPKLKHIEKQLKAIDINLEPVPLPPAQPPRDLPPDDSDDTDSVQES